MRKLALSVVMRLAVGIDMSLSVITYVLLSVLFGEPFNIWFLGLAAFAGHLPDTDMVPYLTIKKFAPRLFKKWLWKGSHWPIGHHPLLLIPACGAVGWWIGSHWDRGAYIAFLVVVPTVVHFVDDMSNAQGFPVLSPFVNNFFISLHGWRLRVVPPDEHLAFYEKVRRGGRGTQYEFQWREAVQINRGKYLLCAVAFTFLLLFLINGGG